MKGYVLLLIAGISTGCFSGCTADSDPIPNGGDSRLELLSVTLPESVSAKSGGGEMTSTGLSSLGVYATKADHSLYSEQASMTYTKSNAVWGCASAINLTNELGEATVYAFSPSGLTVTNEGTNGNHTVPVAVSRTLDFNSSGQEDYLYGVDKISSNTNQPTATSSKRSVSFLMKHALAKVCLVVKKAQSAQDDDMILKEVRILSGTNRMQTGSGRMRIKDGVLSGLVATDTLIVAGSTTLSTNTTTENVTCLVAPMSGAEQKISFLLKVEVDNTAREFVTSTLAGGADWQAGKKYTYTLTLNKMGGSLTDMRAEDWQTDADQNTSIGI